MRVLVGNAVVVARGLAARLRRQPRDQQQQQGRRGHRQADDRHQAVALRCLQQARLGRLAEHHEGEFAAQRQGASQQQAAAQVQPPGAQAQPQQEGELHRQQQAGAGEDRQRFGGHALQVDAHADGHEEQPQQQAFERLDLRFQLVAEFRFRQQHAGQERAEARAQTGELHQPGAAEHHQQGGGGEHLGHAGARDHPEHVAQQVATAEHQRGDRGHRLRHRQPAVALARGGMRAEQRDRGQQRDRREVLEQQDGEREAAVFGGQLLALGQQLQADRGGRQRQPQADHQRGLPREARAHRQQRQRDPRQQHLQAADPEDRPPHHLQARQRQLQPDHEQQHHHADLAGRQHAVGVAHHRQRMRPEQRARGEVAEHRAQPEALEHRHREHRREQEHQREFESAAVHAQPP